MNFPICFLGGGDQAKQQQSVLPAFYSVSTSYLGERTQSMRWFFLKASKTG